MNTFGLAEFRIGVTDKFSRVDVCEALELIKEGTCHVDYSWRLGDSPAYYNPRSLHARRDPSHQNNEIQLAVEPPSRPKPRAVVKIETTPCVDEELLEWIQQEVTLRSLEKRLRD